MEIFIVIWENVKQFHAFSSYCISRPYYYVKTSCYPQV